MMIVELIRGTLKTYCIDCRVVNVFNHAGFDVPGATPTGFGASRVAEYCKS